MIETRVRCERNTYSNQQESDWFDHILTNIEMCLQKTSNVSAKVNFIKKKKVCTCYQQNPYLHVFGNMRTLIYSLIATVLQTLERLS